MADLKGNYAAPFITSFSEAEVMDLLGPARTYPAPDALPTTDPSTGSGATSGPGSDPKKARR